MWSVVGEEPIKPRTVAERFGENVLDAFARGPIAAIMRPQADAMRRYGGAAPQLGGGEIPLTSGALDQALKTAPAPTTAVEKVFSPAAEKERREDYDFRSRADPFHAAPGGIVGKAAAGAATLAGQLGGTALDPTAYLSPGRTVLGRIVGAGAANMATDAVAQGADIGSDVQDKYSPGQTAAAGALGGVIQGGVEGARLAGEVAKAARDLPDALYPLATGRRAPEKPGKPEGPWTVEALWPRLVQQESGGNQEARSKKGARGVAQLMPGTAEYMAKKLGRPELADAALENTPRGAVVNEYLGQLYLNEQLMTFDFDPALALAAYNAGPTRVKEWVTRFGHPDQVGRARWLSMVPFEETRNYVRAILGDAAGPAHKLTDAEYAFVAARTPGLPDDPRAELPPLETPKGLEPEAAPEIEVPDFPGDRPAADGEIRTSIPWDDEAPTPEPDAPDAPVRGEDLTERALNQMRTGKPVQLGEGPSLIEAMVKLGGLRDESGELTSILGGQGENRLFKQLRKVNGGRSLDDAALWAQEHGYIGRPDLSERVTRQDLLDAIRREVSGERVYPPDRINEDARALRDHINDLDEVLQHIGLDPKTATNAEIRQAMDDWFRAAADEEEFEPGSFGMQDQVLGLKAVGATGGEAVAKAREAAHRAAMREIMATTRGGLPGSRKPGAVPLNGDLEPVRGIHTISRQLRTDLDILHRQGRLGMGGALGTFNRRSSAVRTLQMQELDVLAHEIGHAIEFVRRHPNLKKAMRKHTKVLKTLDYNQRTINPATGKPPEGRRHEGFAEWFRWYVTNPDYARQVAPLFFDDFEGAMAIDSPKDLVAIKKAQMDYQAFLSAPSAAAMKAQVVRPPKKGWLDNLLKTGVAKGPFAAAQEVGDEVYRGVVDQLHPWKRAVERMLDIAEERTGFRPSLSVMGDPYKLLRQMPAVTSMGHMDLIEGVHGYHSLERDSPALTDALNMALGQRWNWDDNLIDEFGTYLVGRRVTHLYDRVGMPGGLDQPPDILSKEAWLQSNADFERLHPEWKAAADVVYQWTNALWRKRFDAGLITEEQYLAGLENHPDYVPLFRDISDKEFGSPGSRGSSTKGAGGVLRLRGSARAYINPLHSLMNQAYELNAQIARNDAMKALDDLAMLFGSDRPGEGTRWGAGSVVERLPATEIKGQEIQIEEAIANAAKKYGVDQRDAAEITEALKALFGEEDPTATVYRAVGMNERGEPIVYVWREGKRIPLRLPDGQWGRHMAESLAGMTPPLRSLALEIAATPARVLRGGITANPAFFIANTIRDQMTAAILTDVGYMPVLDQARGLSHEIRQSDLTRIYNVAGGEIGGLQTAAENAAARERNLKALNRQGIRVKELASWRGLASLTELSETGTRQGIFARAFDQAKKRGFSDYAGAREASFEARDYMDFDRHGAWAGTRVAIRVIPFLNAGIQALDKTRRVAGGITLANKVIPALFGGKPPAESDVRAFSHAVKLWTVASALAVGSLALRAAYRDDPEWQEASDYLRNTHWVIKLPSGLLFAVPKPYDIAILANIMERAYEGVALKDPTAWKRLLDGMGEIMIPAHDVAITTPIWNVARNRDSFGAPIVPDYLRTGDSRVQARDQYTDRTSALSRWLGRTLGGEEGVSPAQIDYLIKAYGGSNARDALALSQMALGQKAPIEHSLADTPVAQRFFKDWTRGSVSGKQYWDLISASSGKFAGGVGSVNRLINEGKTEEALERLNKMKPEQRAYTMVSVFGKGQMKQAHPLVRSEEAVRELSGLANDLIQGDVRGPGLQPIRLTPAQRRDAVDALHAMTVAEQRNAMIATGVPGWATKKPLPYEKYDAALQRDAPAVHQALQARMSKVAPLEFTTKAWAAMRPYVEKPQTADTLVAVMNEKRLSGAAGAQRALRDVAPAEALR